MGLFLNISTMLLSIDMRNFSKSLELNGANSTTFYVLLSMIIFLIVLIGGLGYITFKQLRSQNSSMKRPDAKSEKATPKGFY